MVYIEGGRKLLSQNIELVTKQFAFLFLLKYSLPIQIDFINGVVGHSVFESRRRPRPVHGTEQAKWRDGGRPGRGSVVSTVRHPVHARPDRSSARWLPGTIEDQGTMTAADTGWFVVSVCTSFDDRRNGV